MVFRLWDDSCPSLKLCWLGYKLFLESATKHNPNPVGPNRTASVNYAELSRLPFGRDSKPWFRLLGRTTDSEPSGAPDIKRTNKQDMSQYLTRQMSRQRNTQLWKVIDTISLVTRSEVEVIVRRHSAIPK